ncbi:MAG TPA: VOC family protein [Verrucomicrobiae bacterium]|nr:VOC family protein [Verrucomicrobiae bacterium]
MPRVIHFEFAADNPERAAKFYREIFGWESSHWGGPADYWLIKTGADGPGIDGGILQYQDKMPRTINSVDVDSVDAYAEKITRNGGKVAKPKMTIPGVGYQAYFLDTEGNVFGVFQPDPSAK